MNKPMSLLLKKIVEKSGQESEVIWKVQAQLSSKQIGLLNQQLSVFRSFGALETFVC